MTWPITLPADPRFPLPNPADRAPVRIGPKHRKEEDN
jgi:hypothetical protein